MLNGRPRYSKVDVIEEGEQVGVWNVCSILSNVLQSEGFM